MNKADPLKKKHEPVQLDRMFYGVVEVFKGGMGTVRLLHRDAGNAVYRKYLAVKTFDADEDDEEAQIEQELGNWARLSSPCIMPMIKIGRLNFELCAIMPLGLGSLRDRLKESRLTIPQIKQVLLDIVTGLHDAQKQLGVAHLDLKPDNVLVKIPDPLRVRVSDWGLSRMMSRSKSHHDFLTNAKAWEGRQTRDVTAFAAGTFPYMSPERFSGAWKVGPAADVFSLGVMACEMLTARLPTIHGSGTAEECIGAIVSGAYLGAARQLLTGMSANVSSLVLHMLEPDPQRRLSDYAEISRLAANL